MSGLFFGVGWGVICAHFTDALSSDYWALMVGGFLIYVALLCLHHERGAA